MHYEFARLDSKKFRILHGSALSEEVTVYPPYIKRKTYGTPKTRQNNEITKFSRKHTCVWSA